MRKVSGTLLLFLGVAAVVASVWWLASARREPAAASGRPPYVLPVTLAAVERGSLQPRARTTGSVTSAHDSHLGFELAGTVASLEVAEGARVAAGAVLARLDDRDARAALARAEAAADLAQRRLDEVLAGTRAEEKRRLAAEHAARVAEAELAKKQVARGRELSASNVVSKGDMDTWEASLEAADARVRAAAEALAQAEAGARAEEIAVQRAEVDLRRVEVEIARRAFEKSTLLAPFDGAVIARTVSLGDAVVPGEVVLELVDLAHREIEVEIAGSDAARLGERPEVVVTSDEVPGLSLRTELDALVPAADPQSRSFLGLIRLDPTEDVEVRLKPGMFVRVEIALEALRDALIVPADTVRTVASGTIVVRAAESEPQSLVAEWIPVRVLGSHDGSSAVALAETSGAPGASLNAGDRVVLIGVDLAFPGAPLLPREAAK